MCGYYRELDQRTVKKARRDHRCTWCGDLIAKGTGYLYRAGVMDGEFSTDHYHEECIVALRQYFAENPWDDCVEPGEFHRGMILPRYECLKNYAELAEHPWYQYNINRQNR